MLSKYSRKSLKQQPHSKAITLARQLYMLDGFKKSEVAAKLADRLVVFKLLVYYDFITAVQTLDVQRLMSIWSFLILKSWSWMNVCVSFLLHLLCQEKLKKEKEWWYIFLSGTLNVILFLMHLKVLIIKLYCVLIYCYRYSSWNHMCHTFAE